MLKKIYGLTIIFLVLVGGGCKLFTYPGEVLLGNTECTTAYQPVCGEIQPKCITQPCYPILQTYPNKCYATEAGATNIRDGACDAQGIFSDEEAKNMIKIESPIAGSIVTDNPLVIKGEARGGWFSEGQFPVEFITLNGRVMGRGVAKAKGNWMTEKFVSFEGKITYTGTEEEKEAMNRNDSDTRVSDVVPAYKEGIIVLKKANASGDPTKDKNLRIQVKFF